MEEAGGMELDELEFATGAPARNAAAGRPPVAMSGFVV